jgi:HD-GYP domain-containing protein (c-di-GMP phosphodiesterase class II)
MVYKVRVLAELIKLARGQKIDPILADLLLNYLDAFPQNEMLNQI